MFLRVVALDVGFCCDLLPQLAALGGQPHVLHQVGIDLGNDLLLLAVDELRGSLRCAASSGKECATCALRSRGGHRRVAETTLATGAKISPSKLAANDERCAQHHAQQ